MPIQTACAADSACVETFERLLDDLVRQLETAHGARVVVGEPPENTLGRGGFKIQVRDAGDGMQPRSTARSTAEYHTLGRESQQRHMGVHACVQVCSGRIALLRGTRACRAAQPPSSLACPCTPVPDVVFVPSAAALLTVPKPSQSGRPHLLAR